MCKTKEEIASMLADLPEIPGLNSFKKPGEFNGIVQWETSKGAMLSLQLFDNPNCEVWHTLFLKYTEVKWHNHNQSYERIVVVRGKIQIITSDGMHYLLREKDELRIEKEVPHMAMTYDEECEILAMTIPKEYGETTD